MMLKNDLKDLMKRTLNAIVSKRGGAAHQADTSENPG